MPPQVRRALHLSEGDEVEFTVHSDGAVMLPGMTVVPTDQRWFWTEEWQAGEREASAEIAEGDLQVYDDMDTVFDISTEFESCRLSPVRPGSLPI